MKRNIFILLLFSILGMYSLIKAQTSNHFFYKIQDDVRQKKAISALLQSNQLDSAENYCNTLLRSDSLLLENYEEAMAIILLKKNLNDQAYDIVLKDVDYNMRLYGGGNTPLQMLYNHTYGSDLANDTLLEQMCLNKVKDYYATYPFPEGTSGFKIILLSHKMHQLYAAYNYRVSQLKDAKDSMALFNNLQQAKEPIITSFKEILDSHNGFFTNNEIGMPVSLQFYLTYRMPSLKDHEQFQPYFKDAFDKKQIAADEYVDELVKMESFKNSDSIYLKDYKEALKPRYYANTSTTHTLITDSAAIVITEKWDSLGHKTSDSLIQLRKDIPKSRNPKVYKILGEY